MDIPTLSQVQVAQGPRSEAALREAAVALEASFLAQMLENAGLGETPDAFGGGTGESQFGSFLRQAQAEEIAQAGGLGIAEAIYRSLLEGSNE